MFKTLVASGYGFTSKEHLRILRICTAAIAIIGAIAYDEFVYDWRIQRSDQTAGFTMAVSHGLSLSRRLSIDCRSLWSERSGRWIRKVVPARWGILASRR
jgi:hypothetical protein